MPAFVRAISIQQNAKGGLSYKAKKEGIFQPPSLTTYDYKK